MPRWWQHLPAATLQSGNTSTLRAPGIGPARVAMPPWLGRRYQDGLAKKELDDAADRFERCGRRAAVLRRFVYTSPRGADVLAFLDVNLAAGLRVSFWKISLCLAKAWGHEIGVCTPLSSVQVWTTSSASLPDGRLAPERALFGRQSTMKSQAR